MGKQLFPAFNEFVLNYTNSLFLTGFDVVDDFTLCDTFDKIKYIYDKTKRITVWSGGSDKTIFGNPRVNHAFRAWHDLVHIRQNCDFSKLGEYAVMRCQQLDLREQFISLSGLLSDHPEQDFRIMNLLIECEIMGQREYYDLYGNFVEDQYTFAKNWMSQRGIYLPNDYHDQ